MMTSSMIETTYPMSNLHIDSLDDMPMDAGTSGFLGTNSRMRPALIPDEMLSQGLDTIIGETGMSQTRYPVKVIDQTLIDPSSAQGIFYYDTREKERIIVAADNGLYSADSRIIPNWVDLGKTVAGETTFTQLDNNMYFVDGDKYSKWDGTTFTDITSFGNVAKSLPKFNDVITHDNRVLLSGIDDNNYDDDAIYATDILDGDFIDSTYSIRVGGGEGDPIVKILSWHESYVAVLKQRSIYVVNTSTAIGNLGDGPQDPQNWFQQKVSHTLGCVAKNTAVVVGNDVWFLSREGLTSLQRTRESVQRQLSAIILNTEVNDVFEDINWDYADTACAGFFNNRYYISLPIGVSRVPNVTLAYNMLTQKWDGKWTGTAWKPSYIHRSSFGSNRHLIMQDIEGNVYWQKEEGGVYESRDQLPSVVQTSGALEVGESYIIRDYQAGDDFTNVGADSNATGQYFVATGTTPANYTNGSTLAKEVFEDININTISKAWDFGHPINFKAGFNLEIDFFRSHGTVDIILIPDDDETRALTIGSNVDTSFNPKLPQQLPYTFSGRLDRRVIEEIREIEQFKELKVQIIGNGSEVKVRRIQITAFLNTFEVDNS